MGDRSALDQFIGMLRESVGDGTFLQLSLGDCVGPDPTLKRVLIRPVTLKLGPCLSFVYQHARRDITKNLGLDEGLDLVADVLGNAFRAGRLSTTRCLAEVHVREGRKIRLLVKPPERTEPADGRHDRAKQRPIDVEAAWLHALGVTDSDGAVRPAMGGKFRQINRFVEILDPLLAEAVPPAPQPVRLVDMGAGKGYLTFAAADYLLRAGRAGSEVVGIEARPDLVELCNRVARESGCAGLRFVAGTIGGADLASADVVVALHACDTATDDALAKGVKAGAALILTAPCCHKEVRPCLVPPPVLAGALKHGILLEREAEFVTDALRAGLLEWAGYETRVFEFVSTEHTAKNLMIAAVRRRRAVGDSTEAAAREVRDFAAFYGIGRQRLAAHLGFDLSAGARASSSPRRP